MLYESKKYNVVQSIYQKNDVWFLRDYEGNIYKFEDITDDGEVFNSKVGWIQKFYLDYDIELIRCFSLMINLNLV